MNFTLIMTMHRHLASSRKLYLNRRLLAVFSSNKRSGTGERASTLFSGFAVFKNSTRLHFSWRSRAVSRETWKVLDRSDESFLQCGLQFIESNFS